MNSPLPVDTDIKRSRESLAGMVLRPTQAAAELCGPFNVCRYMIVLT